MTHICVSKRTIIGSENGLSPNRRQANIWTNVEILLIGPSGTIFSENRNSYIFNHENAFEIVVWKIVAMLSRHQYVNDDLGSKFERGHAQIIFYWRSFQRTLVRANEVIRESGQLSIGADNYFSSRIIYWFQWTVICSHGHFCSQGQTVETDNCLFPMDIYSIPLKIMRSHRWLFVRTDNSLFMGKENISFPLKFNCLREWKVIRRNYELSVRSNNFPSKCTNVHSDEHGIVHMK